MLDYNEPKIMGGLGFGVGMISLIGYTALNYKTSKSHQWLVRTGLGISNIQIKKKCVKWPFQNIDTINMTPTSYKFSVNAMSKEKMEYNFPAIFTIGPINQKEDLIKYATFLLNQPDDEKNSLIRGIIEGESRTLSANLSIEDIFAGRTKFKNDIVNNVKTQLEQYGLDIFNANVEELRDSPTSNYFKNMSLQIQSQAENRAKVEVSEQNKIGEIGAKEREGDTRQSIIHIESTTKLVENNRQQEIIKSNAELQKLNYEQELIITQANLKMQNEALFLQMELEKDVEIKRKEMELEKQRATDISKSTVEAEVKIKDAEGQYASLKILADANLYQEQKKAEAGLYSREKEAEGILKIYDAEADGIQKVIQSFNGNSNIFIINKMIENKVFEKLAETNATAIHGLNPKINVWTNDANNSMDIFQNLGKSLIPTLDIIKDQTGYSPPDWLINNKINTKE